MADRLEERHPELEAAEFEAERPARELSGLPKLVVSVAAVAVSLYALFWVVSPQPAQPYRTSFLAVTLAMTLLAYRPLARGRSAADEERQAVQDEPPAAGDNPGPLDWALAALAVVALVYPLVVFDDFARRVVRPTDLDVVLGVVAVLLVLEATRRTVGWELGHKGYDLERLIGQTYMGIEGIFGGSPWTWPPPTSSCSPPTGRCWSTRGRAGSSSTSASPPSGPARRPPPAAPQPWPGSCSAPCPGRGWRPR